MRIKIQDKNKISEMILEELDIIGYFDTIKNVSKTPSYKDYRFFLNKIQKQYKTMKKNINIL